MHFSHTLEPWQAFDSCLAAWDRRDRNFLEHARTCAAILLDIEQKIIRCERSTIVIDPAKQGVTLRCLAEVAQTDPLAAAKILAALRF